METKNFKFEIKQFDQQGTFRGYASVFNIIDNQKDKILQGAFKKTIMEKKKFPLFWAHRTEDLPVGMIIPQEDEKGLFVDGELKLGIQKARELYELLKEGIVNGLSIGYKTIKEDWEQSNGMRIRVIKEIKLYEVSLTTFPANEEAVITDVKTEISIVEKYKTEMEEALKNWKEAKQMPEHLLEGLCNRVGDDPGFFTRCVEMSWGTIDDKEAFCAWLHNECLGYYPREGDSISNIEKPAIEKALLSSEPNPQRFTQDKEPQDDISKPNDNHLLKELLDELRKFIKEVK